MKWEVASILFLALIVHAQMIGNNIGHHQLLPATFTAQWNPQDMGEQVNFDYAYSFLVADNHRDMMASSWAYFQPENVPDHGDFLVTYLLPVATVANLLEPFQVQQGDMVKAKLMEAAAIAVATKDADPVRVKRKNILRYRNGEFRPTLCSPRFCMYDRP